ncbi:MAG: gamma-glutamylcyclotransferase [Bacillus sp. (in: firmicutes)]
MGEELYNVFVYGTLLIGECNHHVAEPYLHQREKGTVKGFLYKVDYYPAVVLDTNSREIEGEWFTVTGKRDSIKWTY